MTTHLLNVPGAQLHYEVRGEGPVLLLICGGVYDADAFRPIADVLSASHTVVTYDRRGNSRSSAGVPREPQEVEVHADDAFRVLQAAGASTGAPAAVFGNSSGAIIGLDLAAAHPEIVAVLIAHEPPIFTLTDDSRGLLEILDSVESVLAESGPDAAQAVLTEGLAAARRGAPVQPVEEQERVPGGAEAPQGQVPPEVEEMMGRMARNFTFFIQCEVPYFSRYVPDAARLQQVRIVPAAGELSAGEVPHRCALALADTLGVPAAGFPGDHGGFGSEPGDFAARLSSLVKLTVSRDAGELP